MPAPRLPALVLMLAAVGDGAAGLALPHAVLDAARARYACKSFDPSRPVEPAQLRLLADAARAAPSSFNVQPWRCVLVSSVEGRAALARGMLGANGQRVLEAPLVAVFAADLRACGRAARVAALAAAVGAPAAFVSRLPFYVSLFSSGYRLGLLKWPLFVAKRLAMALLGVLRAVPKLSTPETWAFKNAMPAVTHLMLQAAELGLATLPMEGFDEGRVRAALAIPRRYAIPCVVAVGHASERAAAAPRAGRFEFDELFAAETFGAPWVPPPAPLPAA
ncbi:hypothetical protein KFE25_011259 [Diacronema lutheri]|uniref:Nitroreductase domain-containing protein n=2 Tax=Diacronema lutheri TaxID=2081491 RepID=A0A8J5XKM6_DIALT|nr:hypothetical protein KFE25_011259 [Diacronema lutheri]